MSGGGKDSGGDALDPGRLLKKQFEYGTKTARAVQDINAVNQRTPFGNLTFGRDASGRLNATTSLSPAQQALLEQTQDIGQGINRTVLGNLGQIGQATASPFSTAGAPALPGLNDFGAERQRVEDALFQRATSRLDPRFQQARNREEARLAAQGITQGSAAYDRAIQNFDMAENDAYDAALNAAIAGGGAEQGRLFGQALQGRQQTINEMLQERMQPINELNALLARSPGVQQPGFIGTPQAQFATPDVLSAYSLEAQAKQAANDAKGGTFGSLANLGGSLGSAAIIASDARMKKDAEIVGMTPGGLPIYRYRYKGEPKGAEHIGVMAQDAEAMQPSAVVPMKAVDYARVR